MIQSFYYSELFGHKKLYKERKKERKNERIKMWRIYGTVHSDIVQT